MYGVHIRYVVTPRLRAPTSSRSTCNALNPEPQALNPKHFQATEGRSVEEVVQLYVHDQIASRVRPVRELKGFKKAPGLQGLGFQGVFEWCFRMLWEGFLGGLGFRV